MKPLALNLVMQNEGARIAGCLAHASTYCDEMVVVDQGSTDNSVEIAKMFGARVLERDDLGCPEASYADAEAHTASDRILLLFADEFLRPVCIRPLRNFSDDVWWGTFGRANYVDGINITPDDPDLTLRYYRKGTVFVVPKLHQQLQPREDDRDYHFTTHTRWIWHCKTLAEQRIDLANYERLGYSTVNMAGPR